MSSLSVYARLMRIPGARQFSFDAAIARMSMGMLGIGVVLAINNVYGKWSLAGLVSGVFVFFTAVFIAIYARIFDRVGYRRLGRILLIIQTIAMIGFCVSVVLRAPIIVLFVFIIASGMTQFSFGALVRTRWANVLSKHNNPELLNSAYAMEAGIDEIIFIVGPIIATFLATTVHPASQLFVATATTFIGGLMYFAHAKIPPAHLVEVHPETNTTAQVEHQGNAGVRVEGVQTVSKADRRMVLRYPGVFAIFLLFVCYNSSFTAFDVVITSMMRARHLEAYLGLQLCLIALGSLVGAVLYGVRQPRRGLWTQLIFFVGILFIGYILIRLTMFSFIVIGIIEFLAGLSISPAFAVGNLLVRKLVPEHSLTEGLAWITTAGALGAAAGSAISGVVLDHFGAPVGLILPVISLLLAFSLACFGWIQVHPQWKATVKSVRVH